MVSHKNLLIVTESQAFDASYVLSDLAELAGIAGENQVPANHSSWTSSGVQISLQSVTQRSLFLWGLTILITDGSHSKTQHITQLSRL